MEVELFNICEGAFNHDGRLTIVELFDQIHVARTPLEIACGVAIKLKFREADAGQHTLTVKVCHPDMPEPVGLYSSNINVPKHSDEGRLAIAINIRGFKLPLPGKYKFCLEVDGNVVRENDFTVIRHEGEQQ